MNDWLYVLTGISYYKDNPLNIRWILTVYQTHGTNMSIGINIFIIHMARTWVKVLTVYPTQDSLQSYTNSRKKAHVWNKFSNKCIQIFKNWMQKGIWNTFGFLSLATDIEQRENSHGL